MVQKTLKLGIIGGIAGRRKPTNQTMHLTTRLLASSECQILEVEAMGWGRWLLLGDLGQQMELSLCTRSTADKIL
jgi:hypothetical protein